jgi:hypothetical protein
MRNFRLIVFVFIMAFRALPVFCAPAPDAPALSLSSLVISPGPAQLVINYSLAVENTDVLADLLRDGAHLSLAENMVLVRKRAVIHNKTVGGESRVWYLHHDPLTREFVIISDDFPMLRNRELPDLFSDAWGKMRTVITPTEAFSKGRTYHINLVFSLKYDQVPPWLEKALFFRSWDLIDPIILSLDFIY